MLAKVISGATVGLDSVPVEVEVDVIKKGFPTFTVVGLAAKAIEEARDRVKAAILNSGAGFPAYKIIVNLAPADLVKEGTAYDLPIALGILLANEELAADVSQSLILGELSLDGSLRTTRGVLPMALLARKRKFKDIFVPHDNAAEAAIVEGVAVRPLKSLNELIYHLRKIKPIRRHPSTSPALLASQKDSFEFDLSEIKGQEQARRCLEVAAAGGHNLLMTGPPGAGKTLLARTMPSIMPRLTLEEALEATKIYSVSGKLPPGTPLVTTRPFRAPHHTTSRMGLIGGGSKIQPGEVSLAHRGVLFLDEFPEFPRHVLEALRQPLEDGYVTISRASGTITFPAEFTLVAAQNPCPCGFKTDPQKACRCSAYEIKRYQKRVSGPLLDRIDLHVEVPPVKVKKLTAKEMGESSGQVAPRVQKARDRQWRRFEKTTLKSNAEMGNREIREHCQLEEEAETLLKQAIGQFRLSARSYTKILKIGRTIADLSGSKKIAAAHIGEALQFRPQQEV